jgi:hypothetical protein
MISHLPLKWSPPVQEVVSIDPVEVEVEVAVQYEL